MYNCNFTDYTNHNRIKIGIGLTIANVLMINNFVFLVYVIPEIISNALSGASQFTIILPQAALLVVSIIVYGVAIAPILSKTSLRGEILGDWMLIRSQFGKPARWGSSLLAVNSFMLMYHLVLPIVLYTLVRYRNTRSFALDPGQLTQSYNIHKCQGNVIFKLLECESCLGSEFITDSDLTDHFVKLGNRYFVKDDNAALYLKLSYPPEKLLQSFSIHEYDVMCIMLDLSISDDDIADNKAETIIRSSFTIA